MRIGVLTLPLHTNYGGILQAYAMQHVLKREGHNVVLLDRDRCPLPIWYLSPFVYCKRIFCKLFLRKNVSVFREIRVHNNRKRLRQHTNKFIIVVYSFILPIVIINPRIIIITPDIKLFSIFICFFLKYIETPKVII